MGSIIKNQGENCDKDGSCKVYTEAFNDADSKRQQGKENCLEQYK